MRQTLLRGILVAVLAAAPAWSGIGPEARAQVQVVVGGPAVPAYRVNNYIAPPGIYGTSYGFASFGLPRTYTTFSAFPGPAYGSNYPPYGVLPGRYGAGLWRRGFVAPGYVYGASNYSYRTFPVPYPTGYTVQQVAPPPPIGVYAPALGPRTVIIP
jgi:hypothetical protein